MSGTVRIRHIGVGSSFKVGAVLGGILSAIVMVPMGLLMAVGVVSGSDSSVAADGVFVGLLMMVCGPLIYAFIYGLGMAISALIYNLVAGIMGGLEVELE